MGKLTYSDENGVSRTLLWDKERPDEFQVKTSYNATALNDHLNVVRENYDPKAENNRLLARVPLDVYERSIHENWDDDRWKEFLNHPDNKVFRIWPGRV